MADAAVHSESKHAGQAYSPSGKCKPRPFHRQVMTKIRPFLAVVVLTSTAIALYETHRIGAQADGSILVPTGQRITPTGMHIEVGDRPLGLVRSPDGRTWAVVTGSNFSPR